MSSSALLLPKREYAYPLSHVPRARGTIMPDFESRNLDDTESLARLAELLHPTKVARTEARARGRRRAAVGLIPAQAPTSAGQPQQAVLQHA
jgi:hypothetical protein